MAQRTQTGSDTDDAVRRSFGAGVRQQGDA